MWERDYEDAVHEQFSKIVGKVQSQSEMALRWRLIVGISARVVGARAGGILGVQKKGRAPERAASFGTSTRTHARGVLFRVHKKAAPGKTAPPAAGHLGAVRVRVQGRNSFSPKKGASRAQA
jgi:hypothetical protein